MEVVFLEKGKTTS